MSSLPFAPHEFNLIDNALMPTSYNDRTIWGLYTYDECFDELWQCPVFQVQYEYGNKSTEIEYDCLTLDIILGVIGGFAGLIWQFFGLVTSNYEEFKKNTSLLKSFYSVDRDALDLDFVPE